MASNAPLESGKSLKRPAEENPEEELEEATVKRPRRGNTNYDAGAHNDAKKATKIAVPKPVKTPKERPPSLNPLRKPAARLRPARQLFVYGNGDFGQLGLGPDNTTELFKPKLHDWCAEAVNSGKFGEVGAGIEAVAAGGMHSLMVDEEGKVHLFVT
jgi:regulator of chromosome condensation